MKYRLIALLAILQQSEYDLTVFRAWIRQPRSDVDWQHVNQAEPERWTAKLKLIRSLAVWLAPLVGAPRAVVFSTNLVQLPEKILKSWLLWRAAQRLHHLQANGLTVIAVVGSYGKTSVKHLLHHLLSIHHYTLMTPESVNTPLGIAGIIRQQLTPKHAALIVEFGEQKPGDIARLTGFIRPDIAVITPLGFAHLAHFGSEKQLQQSFQEIADSPHRPTLFIVDDRNQNVFKPSAETIWYGTNTTSPFHLTQIKSTIAGTSGQLHTPAATVKISTPLLGTHQLVNALPGIIVLSLDPTLGSITRALQYASPTPRRLEVHHNPNGTTVIDNSYNSNPGSWQEIKPLWSSLSLGKVALVTAGFVELDPETTRQEHTKFARDIIGLASGVVILRTQANQSLRDILSQYAQKNKDFRYAEAYTLDEALAIIGQQRWPLDTLWLEGGCRELYQ